MPAARSAFAPFSSAILTAVGAAFGTVRAPVAPTWSFGCGEIGSGFVRYGPSLARLSRLAGFTMLTRLAAATAIAAGIAAFEVGRILFLFLKEIGDVEKCIAFESKIDKRGLHAG
jgi:hypothetical protein